MRWRAAGLLLTIAAVAQTVPSLESRVEPVYSEMALVARTEGTVLLQTKIGADGIPVDIRVMRSLGHGLDEEAVKAVALWRFKPGIRYRRGLDAAPVSVRASIEMKFNLKREIERLSAVAARYEYGDEGAVLDNKLAAVNYRLCALAGSAECQLGLGRVLISDSLNRMEAMAWLELAAGNGSADARELLNKEIPLTPADLLEQAQALKKILLP